MNRLKIREPKLDVRDVLPLAELDVLVTPLVAFDVSGQRLGMGGGFTTGRCKTGSSIACSRWATRTTASRWIACRAKSGISRCRRSSPRKNPVLVGTRGREIQPESINKNGQVRDLPERQND